MNKEMIIAVMNRLEKNVPQIRWVDAEMGQLSGSDERPPVAFPCALVDLSYTSCETLSGGAQKIKATVKIRIAFDWIPPTSTGVPVSLREKAFGYLDVLESVNKALHWWDGGKLFNPMRRISCMPERSGKRKIYVITYETEFID